MIGCADAAQEEFGALPRIQLPGCHRTAREAWETIEQVEAQLTHQPVRRPRAILRRMSVAPPSAVKPAEWNALHMEYATPKGK